MLLGRQDRRNAPSVNQARLIFLEDQVDCALHVLQGPMLPRLVQAPVLNVWLGLFHRHPDRQRALSAQRVHTIHRTAAVLTAHSVQQAL